MQRFGLWSTQAWYTQLPLQQKELVRVSLELYAREERTHSHFSDYSFIVFPMAKAYEGFLKKYLYDFGLITQATYLDKRFRIGRALNPDVSENRKDEYWVYGRVEDMCGREAAREFWNTWLECRNQIFHYFPDRQKSLSLSEAEKLLEKMAGSMDLATHCTISKG